MRGGFAECAFILRFAGGEGFFFPPRWSLNRNRPELAPGMRKTSMLKNRLLVPALVGLCLIPTLVAAAASFSEDFSSNPLLHGWGVSGDTNLFAWNPIGTNLQVTWDSAQTNSYFYHPLGTVLGKEDDFALEFELRLSDISTNTATGPFEIAIGFINFAEATSANFWRGSGIDPAHGPRDLAEFDYFPAGYYDGYGPVYPSISPTLVDSDNNFASGFALLELTTNDLFHVWLTYSASNQTLHTDITRNGAPYGPVDDVTLPPSFTDMRLDTVAVCSYSAVGDPYDSVLAHGTVDYIVVTLPPPPVVGMTGGFANGAWQAQFTSRTNWVYSLERTVDFQSWTAVAGPLNGDGTNLTLVDPMPPADHAFYRVRALLP